MTDKKKASFPTAADARQAQVERLRHAREVMLRESSYERMRDWFTASDTFATGKTELAAWVTEELQHPDRLADTIMESVFTPERTREIFDHILDALEEKACQEDIQGEIARILSAYVERMFADDAILRRICKEVEDRLGTAGGIADFLGVIDTRVITHDIADALRRYVASIDNEHRGDYERIVGAILQGLRGVDLTTSLAQRTIRGLVVEVVSYAGKHVVASIESFDLTSLTPGQNRVGFRMYKGLVNSVFDVLESFAGGKDDKRGAKKSPGLFDVVNGILREA